MATIEILDSNLNKIGLVSNDMPSATPFYDAVHSNRIAENGVRVYSETISLKVPSQYPEAELLERGNHLLIEDSKGRYKLFAIEETSESINGNSHLKSVDVAYNAFITDMRNYTYIEEPKTFSPATTTDIIKFICAGAGWNYGELTELYHGSAKTFEVLEGNALSSLDSFTTQFGIDIEAYVEVVNGKIKDKIVKFSMTDPTTVATSRFEYRQDLTDATRKATNTDFATMLYPYTMADDEGKRKSIKEINEVTNPYNGKKEKLPYIYDAEANDKYNNGRPYIKLKIQTDTIGTKEATLAWAKEQLNYYNHPKYEYSVGIHLFRQRPALGDYVELVDLEMSPPLSIKARVIAEERDLATGIDDKIVIGEFKEVEIREPDSIKALQEQLANLQQSKKPVYDIQDFQEVTSEGATLRVVVREDGRIMNLDNTSFSWKRFDNNTQELDEAWSAGHASAGPQIKVSVADFDKYSYYCYVTIEDYDYIGRADFRTGMTDFLKRVNRYVDSDTAVLAFFTDSHYDNNSSKKDDSMKESFARALTYERNVIEFTRQANVDAVIHGGDVIDGRKEDKSIAITNLDSAIGGLRNAKAPRIIMRGNHDTNPIFAPKAQQFRADGPIPNKDAYGIFTQFWQEDGIRSDDNTNAVYGFYDIPNKDIRLIFLDPMDLDEVTEKKGENLLQTHSPTYETITVNATASQYKTNAIDVDGVRVKAGDTITFRAKVKTTNNRYGTARLLCYRTDGTTSANNALLANRVRGEGYTYITYTIPTAVKRIEFGFANDGGATGTPYDIEVKEAKAEIASTPTDYKFFEEKRKYVTRTTYAYGSKQLEWLADTLIETPDTSDVLLLTHVALTRDSTTIEEINKHLVIDIINAWRAGGAKTFTSTRADYLVNFTRDFGAPTGSNLIATISGHNHKDTAGRSPLFNSIIPNFTRTCVFRGYDENEWANRPFDSLYETAFDAIIIDKKNTTIRFVRYGYGEDKITNYTARTVIDQDNPNIDEGEVEDNDFNI